MAKRKPNIVDILIIVVVVALCAVAVFKFGVVNQKESAGVDDSEEQRTYTALIDEVRMATVNALHEGDKIYDFWRVIHCYKVLSAKDNNK